MARAVKPLSAPSSSTNPLLSAKIPTRERYRSPLRYPGGKQKAIEQIFQHFPKSAHEYREPLVGGGSVYFHARTIGFAHEYWINDKFKELVSFWQAAQDPKTCHKLRQELEELRCKFSTAADAKNYFNKVRWEEPDSLYRQAFLFFFFNRVTFSGTTRAGGFSSAASQHRFTASSIDRMACLPEALAGVEITNLDVEEVIRKPGQDVFIFLDPPYYRASKLYGHGGSLHAFDHVALARCLKNSPHRFLITYDDCPEIRSLYDWAEVKDWSLQYGMNNCNLNRVSKIGAELFISNY